MSPDLIDAARQERREGHRASPASATATCRSRRSTRSPQVAKTGVVVVRSTRLGSGLVLRNNEVDDDKMGFVASGELNPGKSRVLLQLALMKTTDPKNVQRMFNEY